jgi:hypothetical protein
MMVCEALAFGGAKTDNASNARAEPIRPVKVMLVFMMFS